jgi:hypothetical protein
MTGLERNCDIVSVHFTQACTLETNSLFTDLRRRMRLFSVCVYILLIPVCEYRYLHAPQDVNNAQWVRLSTMHIFIWTLIWITRLPTCLHSSTLVHTCLLSSLTFDPPHFIVLVTYICQQATTFRSFSLQTEAMRTFRAPSLIRPGQFSGPLLVLHQPMRS